MPNPVPQFKKIDTEKVLFDSANPRLGDTSTLTQPQLQEILLEEPHYAKDLVESFVENGFIEYEPLVVREEGEHYVVIEGNRRLAAVKHILENPDKYPRNIVDSLKQVPVLIFHENADESHLKDIRTYLGVRHLKGYREWPAESKAIFLDRNIQPGTDLKKLKSEFGIEAGDIRRFLVPYRIRKSAQEIIDDFDLGSENSFWILGEALGRAGIKEYIELKVKPKTFDVVSFDREKFRNLIEFLYGADDGTGTRKNRRISDTRQLSRLAKVLANKRASEKLENGASLKDAELYMSTPEEAINLQIAVLGVTLDTIRELSPNGEQISRVREKFENFAVSVAN